MTLQMENKNYYEYYYTMTISFNISSFFQTTDFFLPYTVNYVSVFLNLFNTYQSLNKITNGSANKT